MFLCKSYQFFSSALFRRFLVSAGSSTTMLFSDGVYFANWGLIVLRFCPLWLLYRSRGFLPFFPLLSPSLDEPIKMILPDEFLNLIMKLNTLLCIMAVISVIQIVFIWISPIRMCPQLSYLRKLSSGFNQDLSP